MFMKKSYVMKKVMFTLSYNISMQYHYILKKVCILIKKTFFSIKKTFLTLLLKKCQPHLSLQQVIVITSKITDHHDKYNNNEKG